MSQFFKKVVGKQGIRYNLTEKLGGGSQGDVYKVDGGKYAVKLFNGISKSDEDRLNGQLAEVRRFDLIGLPIAKPIELLRAPDVGYVMELLDGMDSIGKVFFPRKGLQTQNWYFKSGGLRRRLRVLSRIGNVLAKVHSYSLVYPDISHNNIFVTKSSDDDRVWLIDADNIHLTSYPGTRQILYTRGYGAPEIVHGNSGMNSLTDAYAFAVLVFWVITLAHPFVGNMVENEPAEKLEDAYAGKIPFIDHSTDDQNRSSIGIPRFKALTHSLRKLSQKTFQDSLFSPENRPSINEWTEAIDSAALSLIDCPDCGKHFYYINKNCPWCNRQRPAFLLLDIKLWDASISRPLDVMLENSQIIKSITIASGSSVVIEKMVILSYINEHSYDPILEIGLDGQRVTIRSMDQQVYHLSTLSSDVEEKVTDQRLRITVKPSQMSWLLHLGQIDRLHRVVLFKYYSEVNEG